MLQKVIAIFDIGKTNKKLFLFNDEYKIVYEQSSKFEEIVDEDGFPCDDIKSLSEWVKTSLLDVLSQQEFDVKAINFSTYGASFVYINDEGEVFTPLYNYLKPYAENLQKQFYDTYSGEDEFSRITASPVLGNLNSGMQVYRIKYEKPEVFKKIKRALHLPHYVSYLLTGDAHSEITSIGCHTNLWNFDSNEYHQWVKAEGIDKLLPKIKNCTDVLPTTFPGAPDKIGVGLHDSSAALIPYLMSVSEPFILISSGTWCISLNPFNNTPLTIDELKQDCLCYLQYTGQPVKASRLFAGHEHDEQSTRIATYFSVDTNFYKHINYDPKLITALKNQEKNEVVEHDFSQKDLSVFSSIEEAYHQLMLDLVSKQFVSTSLVMKGSQVKKIFVDGGFSKNIIFMKLLADVFLGVEVYAASVAQATSLGAALAIHHSWNTKPLPNDLVQLEFYRHSENS
jgi:sugar (pentulose or hexulose) kinase